MSAAVSTSASRRPALNAHHARIAFGLAVALLIALWWTRLHALDALPLHNDEGLHLQRAVQVWNGNLFWEIRDGKIINHWLIAAFYPQNAPVWMSRIPTILVALVGLAGGLSLGRRLAGRAGMLLVGLLWVGSSYLFFYERMAFSDAEAGALGSLALLLSVRRAADGRLRTAALTGAALAAALLFKFTAAPFGLSVALVVLAGSREPWPRRLRHLLMIGGIVGMSLVPPLLFLLLRGGDLFSIALGWLGAGGTGGGSALAENAARLLDIVIGLNSGGWALLVGAGWLAALIASQQRGLALAAVLPLLLMLAFGRDAQSRHFAAALPPLIGVAGGALCRPLRRLPPRLASAGFVGIAGLVAFTAVPFALQAYRDPAGPALPELMRRQYITEHSSGYGLRDAMASLSQIATRPDVPVFASLFPDSCRRANFYAVGRSLICTDAPYVSSIEAALAAQGAVYVLVERPGELGMARDRIHAAITEIAVYPRPGETVESASLHLWLLERTQPNIRPRP
jgi:hypothetical protein